MTKLFIAFLMVCLLQTTTLTYKNATNRFTIDYPSNWVQKTNVNAIIFLSPKEDESDTFQENVNLILQDLSGQNIDLKKYEEITKAQISEHAGTSTVVTVNDIVFNGEKAKEIIFSANLNNRMLKMQQKVFIKNDMAYLFTYIAEAAKFEKFQNAAGVVIDSFKFY